MRRLSWRRSETWTQSISESIDDQKIDELRFEIPSELSQNQCEIDLEFPALMNLDEALDGLMISYHKLQSSDPI